MLGNKKESFPGLMPEGEKRRAAGIALHKYQFAFGKTLDNVRDANKPHSPIYIPHQLLWSSHILADLSEILIQMKHSRGSLGCTRLRFPFFTPETISDGTENLEMAPSLFSVLIVSALALTLLPGSAKSAA